MQDAVVVLGADAPALGVAAHLALAGRPVCVWDDGPRSAAIDTLQGRPRLRVSGPGTAAVIGRNADVVELAAATADPFEALAAGDLVLACGASCTRDALAELVLPLLEPRHTLVMLSGTLETLSCAKWLADRGRVTLPTFVESDVSPVMCRASGPGHVHLICVVPYLGFGVFPACRSAATIATLHGLFPDARAHAHALAAALSAPLPLLRAAALLMNAGVAERAAAVGLPATFSLFRDGFEPGVARVAEALDEERLALAAALDLNVPTAAETLHSWGLSPRGDLWSAVAGSYALTHMVDCPGGETALGARLWVELAGQLGVPAPLMSALAAMSEVLQGAEAAESGPSLEALGIAGMQAGELVGYLETGSRGVPA